MNLAQLLKCDVLRGPGPDATMRPLAQVVLYLRGLNVSIVDWGACLHEASSGGRQAEVASVDDQASG